MDKLKAPFTWKRKPVKKKESNPFLPNQILNAFFHHTTDSIVISDPYNNILLVNQAFEHLYGWTSEDVIASPYCFVPEELIDETKQLLDAVRFLGVHLTNYETYRRKKDGTLVDVNYSASPIRDNTGNIVGIACTTRDISDRKKVEEALKESEAKYRMLIDHTNDIITIFDPSMKRLYASPSVELHLGYTHAEYVHSPSLGYIHPEDLPNAIAKKDELLKTNRPILFEARSMSKNGIWVSFETRGVPIFNEAGEVDKLMFVSRNVMERKFSEAALLHSEKKYRIIAEHTDDLIMITDKYGKVMYTSPSHERVVGSSILSRQLHFQDVHPDDRHLVTMQYRRLIASKEPHTCEFRYKRADGDWIVLESKAVPILAEGGDCDGFIVISRDITERRNNEALLRKAEKLSLIGELAAGIAHEIRNPLTSLKGFIQLLQPTLAENKMYADIMLGELERINFIVSELLVLAKPQNLQVKPLSLVSLLQNVLALLASEANLKNIRFQTSFAQHSLIKGEENQLKQVFINIIKNSIEAIPGYGEIRISTRLLPEGRVLIRLADTGCGIDDTLISKVGEPFYTTKEKGTGLGLMISSKIIKDHNGHLTITSEKGKGTVVDITLPIAFEHIGSC